MYLRKLSVDDFYTACLPFLEKQNVLTVADAKIIVSDTGEKMKPAQIKSILSLEQARAKRLEEIPDAIRFFFVGELEYDCASLIWRKSDKEKTLGYLKQLEKLLKKIKAEDFSAQNIEKEVMEYLQANSIDNGSMLWPMRFALSGREKSPGPFEIASALGKKKAVERISAAIERLSK